MSDQQNLLNFLNTTIPDNINKLAATKQKTQDIIKYCNNLYINQDKESSYAKTEQYVDSVFTNVIYFVTQTSSSIMDMLDSQTKEIDRVNTDVSHVSSKLKQLRTVAGVEEMLKFNTPKPTLRSKKMKKIKLEPINTEKVIEGHIQWDKYDRIGVTLFDVKQDLGVTESFRKSTTGENHHSLEAPLEDDLPPPSLDMDENGEPVLETTQSFKKPPSNVHHQETNKTSRLSDLPPPSLDLGPPGLDIPDMDVPGPPDDSPRDSERPPMPQQKPPPPTKPTSENKPPPPTKPTVESKPPPPTKPVVAPTKVTPPTPKPTAPVTAPKPTTGGKGGPPGPPPPPPSGGPPPPPPVTTKTSSSNDGGGDLASQLAKKKALKKVAEDEKKISDAPKIDKPGEEKPTPSGGGGGGGDMMSQMLAKRMQMSKSGETGPKPPTQDVKPIPQKPSLESKPVPPTTTSKPGPPIPMSKPVPPTVSKPTPPTTTSKPTPPTTTSKPGPPPMVNGKPGPPPPPPSGPPPPPVTKSAPKPSNDGDLASQLAKKKALKKVE